jgi:hypothetical protein
MIAKMRKSNQSKCAPRSGGLRPGWVGICVAAVTALMLPSALLATTNVVSQPAGLLRATVPPASEALLSMPFIPFNPDIHAVFQDQLTGSDSTDTADAIRQWDTTLQAYTNGYKAAGTGNPANDGRWVAAFTNAAPSTLCFNPGVGFWVANRQAVTQTLYLCGHVVPQSQGALTIGPGLSLLGYPFSTWQRLNDTTLRTDGAYGAGTAPPADNLYDLVGGEFATQWLLNDSNAPCHGQWLDAATNLSEVVLQPGRGYWYRRAPASGFNWQEYRPYAYPFPTNATTPAIQSMTIGAGQDCVTLRIIPSGVPGEKLDLYYKDLDASNAITSTGWQSAAINLAPGGAPLNWTDAGSPSRSKIDRVFSRHYLVGRADIDSDGDGVPDSREQFLYGSNPFASDLGHLLSLIFAENFETNTVQAGELNGQNGWVASPAGACRAQGDSVKQGVQALSLAGIHSAATPTVSHAFTPSAGQVVWVDFITRVTPSAAPATIGSASVLFLFDRQGRLVVYDGFRAGSNLWLTLDNQAPLHSWARITLKLDYTRQTWTIHLNGCQADSGLGFANLNGSGLSAFTVAGQQGFLDALTISSNKLACVSQNGKSLPDEWVADYFGETGAEESDDPDHDGLSNLEEFLAGTHPLKADTDGDGLPDRWELLMGTAPLVPDAVADPDRDGLTNLREYPFGTNPLQADTDDDGMPDQWEADHQFNPLVNDAALDSDGDGLSNLEEYFAGTDPRNPDMDNDGLLDSDEVRKYDTDFDNPDTDGDRLNDGWEIQYGLNPFVVDSASADPDGDGLSNQEECLAGTNPLCADTDGDGMNDNNEILGVGSNPLVADVGARIVFAEQNGAAGQGSRGTWQVNGTDQVGFSDRGKLDFTFAVATAGVYAVEFEVAQYVTAVASAQFGLATICRGVESDRRTIPIAGAQSLSVLFFLPALPVGTSTVSLVWSPISTQDSCLVVRKARLVRFGGADANNNGVSDWEDARHVNLLRALTIPESSCVSPVCLEGESQNFRGVTVTADGLCVPVRRAVRSDWFANVPLSPTSDTTIAIAAENGAVAATSVVAWTAFNLLQAPTNTLLIRAGSTLKLVACPSNQTSGAVTLSVLGVTNYVTTAGRSVLHTFPAGTYTVRAAFSNAAVVTNAQLTVRAVGASFPYPIACLLGQARSYATTLDPVVQIEADPRLNLTTNRVGNAVTLNITSFTLETQYLAYRLGLNGPLLDAVAVQTLDLYNGDFTKNYVAQTFSDGSQMISFSLALGTMPSNFSMRIYVSGGATTLDDGTSSRIVTAADFSADGIYTYNILRSADSAAYFCHGIAVYQANKTLGNY